MQAEFQRMLADRLEEHAPHYRLTNLQYRQAASGDCRQLTPQATAASSSICAPEAAVRRKLADCLACAWQSLQLLVLPASQCHAASPNLELGLSAWCLCLTVVTSLLLGCRHC